MLSPENQKLNELFESKFYCPQRFAEEFEKLVHTSKEMKYVMPSFTSVRRITLTLSQFLN